MVGLYLVYPCSIIFIALVPRITFVFRLISVLVTYLSIIRFFHFAATKFSFMLRSSVMVRTTSVIVNSFLINWRCNFSNMKLLLVFNTTSINLSSGSLTKYFNGILLIYNITDLVWYISVAGIFNLSIALFKFFLTILLWFTFKISIKLFLL